MLTVEAAVAVDKRLESRDALINSDQPIKKQLRQNCFDKDGPVLGPNPLVEHRCVRIPVFFDDGHDEHDEFGPEVQVLDARTLLFQRQLFFILD